LLVFALCGVAFVCHAVVLASCNLLSLDGDTSTGSYGLFFLNVPDSGTDQCTEIRAIDEITGLYGDGIIWQPREDHHLRAAQIGCSFALGCGFALVIFVFFRQFFCPLPCSGFIMDVCGLAVQVGLAMVYLLWLSDGCTYFECDYGEGMPFLICAQVFWMIAGCFIKCMRPSAAERKKMEAEEQKKMEAEEQKKRGLEMEAEKDESGDEKDKSEDYNEESEDEIEEIVDEKEEIVDEKEEIVDEKEEIVDEKEEIVDEKEEIVDEKEEIVDEKEKEEGEDEKKESEDEKKENEIV